MTDGNKMVLVGKEETFLTRDGYYTETIVRPKNQDDRLVFEHCNGGKSVSSSGRFQNEIWPLLQLHVHGYVSYEIEDG